MLEGLVITSEVSVLRLYIFHKKSKHEPVSNLKITSVAMVVIVLTPIIHGLAFFHDWYAICQ